jgi:hypothetical protein
MQSAPHLGQINNDLNPDRLRMTTMVSNHCGQLNQYDREPHVTTDPRLDYPATRRNRDPILAVLREVLPASGTVLEISSGSGQHVAHFAEALQNLRWQPTDIDASVFPSIAAWTGHLDNVAPPALLDVTSDDWPLVQCDAAVCANMIHIAPWTACLGLLDGVSKRLGPAAPLCLYGPFKRGGVHTSPSNATFDESLRARNADWGVRDLDEVAREAKLRGLVLERVFEMPANNLTVIFRTERSPYLAE